MHQFNDIHWNELCDFISNVKEERTWKHKQKFHENLKKKKTIQIHVHLWIFYSHQQSHETDLFNIFSSGFSICTSEIFLKIFENFWKIIIFGEDDNGNLTLKKIANDLIRIYELKNEKQKAFKSYNMWRNLKKKNQKI